jgi:hypothetical protein
MESMTRVAGLGRQAVKLKLIKYVTTSILKKNICYLEKSLKAKLVFFYLFIRVKKFKYTYFGYVQFFLFDP